MMFIADSMLGDVARWLRMLGHDTLYSRRLDDWKILQIAEKDGRIIITRDRGLYMRARKKGLKAVLIDSNEMEEILAKLALKTGLRLEFDPSATRCPYCNVRLEVITKAEALSLLPQKVVATYDSFWRCPKCGRIYWQGSHWRTIGEVLKNARKVLQDYGRRWR
jgi:uncharacterized protein with PIN domain